LATLGGAEALGMDKIFGNFVPGKKLDCLVVDVFEPTGPIDVFPGETLSNHFEKFLYLGDDRNIRIVIVDGKVVIDSDTHSGTTAAAPVS
jgi:guanine deaminase